MSWGEGSVELLLNKQGEASSPVWHMDVWAGPPCGGVCHGGQSGLYLDAGSGISLGQMGRRVVAGPAATIAGARVASGGGVGAGGLRIGGSTCMGLPHSLGGLEGCRAGGGGAGGYGTNPWSFAWFLPSTARYTRLPST